MAKYLKVTTVLFSLFLFIGITSTDAQITPRYVTIEHFTNTSCGPCAAQNPVFHENILHPYREVVHHIAYHTSWPGYDPFYEYNKTQSSDRVNYYGVSGVPRAFMLGDEFEGGPANITPDTVEYALGLPTPIKVEVQENPTDSLNRDVNVTVKTVDTVPSGNYKLRVAIVEEYINYLGNNGEEHHYDVFRKMLPNTTGATYNPAAIGDTVQFNYNYKLDTANWNTSKIYAIAFVQNDNNTHILNSGSSIDPRGHINVNSAHKYARGANNQETSFDVDLQSIFENLEWFKIKLTQDAPADWEGSFTINGNTYSDSTSVPLPKSKAKQVSINVTPGGTPAIGEFTLSVKSNKYPQTRAYDKTFKVMFGIRDLIVDHDGGNKWERYYKAGLNLANNKYNDIVNSVDYLRFARANALDSVNNIYWNAAWEFPYLTNEEVKFLSRFLDRGGNLFIAGQDLGWDTYDPSGNGTPKTRSFYENYLQASWDADGDTANSQLTPVLADSKFGNVDTSEIIDIYGGDRMYPDEISPIKSATSIFQYKGDTGQVAGIRAYNDTFKVVYLGVGLEMISDSTVSSDIVRKSHDWFYEGVSIYVDTTNYKDTTGVKTVGTNNNALRLGQNYPNPGDHQTIIPVHNKNGQEVQLRIMNIYGKVVWEKDITKRSTKVNVNTAPLSSGLYLYQLKSGQQVVESKRMLISH